MGKHAAAIEILEAELRSVKGELAWVESGHKQHLENYAIRVTKLNTEHANLLNALGTLRRD